MNHDCYSDRDGCLGLVITLPITLAELQRYMKKDDDETRSLFDLISRMLEYDPVERITLKEALSHQFFDISEEDLEKPTRQPSAPRELRTSKSR